MDNLRKGEKEGVTIDLSHKNLKLTQIYYNVDCPGHRDFVKILITGHLRQMLQFR